MTNPNIVDACERWPVVAWGLRPSEALFLEVLTRRDKIVTYDTLYDLFYEHDPNGGAQQKVFHVFKSQVKKCLERNLPFAVSIKPVVGVGYYMPNEDRLKVLQFRKS